MTIERTTLNSYSHGSFDPDQLALEFGGDVTARVAAMALLSAKESGDAATEARQAEEERLVQQQEAQIQHMHEQADAMRAAAEAQAFGELVGAGFQFAGAIAEKPASQALFGAASKAAPAAGKLAASAHSFDGEMAEAGAVRSGQLANATERRLEELQSVSQDARDLRRDALEFYRNASQIESASEQAIFVRA